METDKLITIVVPVRNRANIVVRTLDSIAAQTFSQFHLIVVDNGSTDCTVEKIVGWTRSRDKEWPTIELLHCNEIGATNARNFGLEHVRTPWVMFFDSDDEMRPNHVAHIAQELQAFPNCELIYFDATMMDADGWCHPKSVEDNDMMRGHLFHCSLSTQRMAMRTELARRAGGWQNECAIWNDLEFGVRLLMNTQNVRKLHGDPQVVIHPHASDSITGMCYRDRAGLHEKSLNVIDSHFRHADHSLYHLWVECRRMILAAMYAREGEKERARAIRRDVASRNRGSDNLKLRTVYAVQRVLGHGGSATAIRLFRATAPKAK